MSSIPGTRAVRGLASAGFAAGAAAVRPATSVAVAIRRAEHDARERAVDSLGRAALGVLDSALVSPYTDVAVQHVLDSALLERTIASALDRAESADAAERIAERMLVDGIAERLAQRLLAGPELERLVALALSSPGMERLVTQVVESRVVDEAVTRLIDDAASRLAESEPVWRLVDIIAQSPAVTEAIAQQGAGFADQVAGEVRDRSRNIDARLERGAWRLLRRRVQGSGPGGAQPAGGAT